MPSSRMSFDNNLKKESWQKSLTLSDGIFHENIGNPAKKETEDPEEHFSRAQGKARENQKAIVDGQKSSKTIFSTREYAQALHCQADVLHHKGDYEMALVLYHRAANAYPREASHGIAAKRTAAALNSVTNSAQLSKTVGPSSKSVTQLVGISCPETAAQRAKEIVEKSADPISAIEQILKYFDSRKDFLRAPPIFRDRRRSTQVSRSRTMLRQLGSMASVALENLQVTFAAGDLATSLRIGNELLTIAEPLIDRYRYEVAARHYLAMTQIALGRHDRAVDQVVLMIGSAKKSGDTALKSRSFMTLGRVHLTFRHLDAAAKAWQRLVRDLNEVVPKAWLLHEIGRCYFEMKSYGRALETSYRCVEYAEEGNSQKWLLNGRLLSGQALVELGRLGEAVEVLKKVRTIADEEKNKEILDYVSELIDRITGALRNANPLDNVFETSVAEGEKIVETEVWRAKSEEVPKSDQSKTFKWSRQKSENLRTEPKLKIKLPKCRGKKIRCSMDFRRINSNCKISTKKRKGKNINKPHESSIPMSSSGELDIFEKDIPQDFNADFSAVLDESWKELLTSRTRVIDKNIGEQENSIEEFFRENQFVSNEERCLSDEELSIGTEKTYVFDEL